MADGAQELLDLLDLEPLDKDLFRGTGAGGETPTRIYGGQVIAQALAAAYRTVPDDRLCHSLHAYFIRPGNPAMPVIYNVDRARDGGSFTTRRVVAIQNGKQILNLSCSFHIQEPGWEHQHTMPDVPAPETLISRHEHNLKHMDRIPGVFHPDILRPRPIEMREVAPRDPMTPEPVDDINHVWIRMQAAAGQSPQMQHVLLAYVSDYGLMGSALRPHGLNWFQRSTMTASLDHAMWFHGPIAFEDWHLYAMDAPFSGGARGFNRGSIFTRDGRLVASVAQEGLMRPLDKA
ncbi:MAG: acyl-CoA thioesterase II [Rhodobacteraceae bacterium]|nr:acyl-CoA thioesterase II [Paracoccaceae bacterium]